MSQIDSSRKFRCIFHFKSLNTNPYCVFYDAIIQNLRVSFLFKLFLFIDEVVFSKFMLLKMVWNDRSFSRISTRETSILPERFNTFKATCTSHLQFHVHTGGYIKKYVIDREGRFGAAKTIFSYYLKRRRA